MRDIDWDMKDKETDLYTSQIHPYPAKFIPQIPKILIEEYTREGDLIFDPFNGSGTTTMVSSKLKRESYGCDLNPLACMIARAKSRNYQIKDLKRNRERIKNKSNKVKSMKEVDKKYDGNIKTVNGEEVEIPDFPDRYEWFLPEVVNQIGALKYEINQISNKKTKNLFLITLSSILKRICRSDEDYTYIGDNMLPTSKTNSMTPDNKIYDVYDNFIQKLEKNIDRVKEYSEEQIPEPNIMCMDSRDSSKKIKSKVDLTVTSPPYVNAVDYARYHRLSFYWLDFPVRDIRDEEIGARSKRGRKKAVEDYFDEVKEVYKEVFRITRDNGKLCIVIGNSQHKKEEIETSKRTLSLCENIGFSHIDTFTREVSNQSMAQKKIRKEDIHVLKK
jgi:DNA modification methylase